MGIRACLAAAAAALLAPLVLLTAWNVLQRFETERMDTLARVLERTRHIARSLDDELAAAETTLRVLASSPHLGNGDLTAFRSQTTIARIPNESAIRIVCAAGVTPSNARPDVETTVVGRRLDSRSNPGDAESRASGDAGRSKLRIGVDLTVPIPADDSECRLVQTFDADALHQWTDVRLLPADWTLSVFDRDLVLLAQMPVRHESNQASGPSWLRDAALNRTEGYVSSRAPNGTERYDIYARANRSGWLVAIEVPSSAMTVRGKDALPWTLAALLATVALAICVGHLMLKRLRTSLTSLERATQALQRDEPLPPHHHSVPEVDALRTALEQTHVALTNQRSDDQRGHTDCHQQLEEERTARETGDQKNRAKDEFIAMLGHELRNPLNAISGALALLQHGAPPPNDKEAQAREVIDRQIRQLGRVADQLLDLGRWMSNKKMSLHLELVDLANVCRNALASMQRCGRLTDNASILKSDAIWIRADQMRLEQAIGIVVCAALENRSPQIRVELLLTHDAKQATLAVRDVGLDIPPHLAVDAVDSAAGRERPPDQTPGGPSIELGIAEKLIQLHNGHFERRLPRPGRGTEFIVRLPLADPPTRIDANDIATTNLPAGLRVLVVDDHEDSRTMLRLLLQQAGHHPVEAVDGIEGVQLALSTRPDVAIVDIGLPGIDGYEVARRLRKLPRGAESALIALTGYGQTEDRERAFRAGFDVHLVKPVDAEKLGAALVQSVRLHSSEAANTDRPAG